MIWLKNLLFTLVVPGSVSVYLPWMLVGAPIESDTPLTNSPLQGALLIAAILLWGSGALIYGWCVYDFATFGRGTPAPIDAPKKLVVRGLYRRTRNPMYVGVLTVILGWVIATLDWRLGVYLAAVWSCFHLMVVLYEEPHLRRTFGEDFDGFCGTVPRWIPRLLSPLTPAVLVTGLLAACAAPESGSGVDVDAELQGPAADAGEVEWKILPGKMCRDLFLLELTFPKRPDDSMWLLMDTGASHTVLDPESLQRLTTWRAGDPKSVRLRDVNCGPITFKTLPAVVRDLDHIGRALRHPIDGILGFPAFRQVLLTLDYAAGHVAVAHGSLPAADGRTLFKFRLRKNNRPFVPLQIDGRERLVLLDSGSGFGISVEPSRRWHWHQEPRKVGTRMRFNGPEFQLAGSISTQAELLGVSFPGPVVNLTDDTELVGNKIMRHLTWTFDQRRRVVRAVPLRLGPVRGDPLRGSGAILGTDAAGVRVVMVMPGTPAATSPLQVDDRVLAINGVPVARLSCDTLDPLEEGGKRFFDYQIQRGERTFAVRLEEVVLVPVVADGSKP